MNDNYGRDFKSQAQNNLEISKVKFSVNYNYIKKLFKGEKVK